MSQQPQALSEGQTGKSAVRLSPAVTYRANPLGHLTLPFGCGFSRFLGWSTSKSPDLIPLSIHGNTCAICCAEESHVQQ